MARFLKLAQKAVGLRGQVTVLLTTDAAIRRLNRRFRGKNKATDVLSFPAAGWTLALDFPARTRGLGPLLDELDKLVVEHGGRVYLAKDSRVSAAILEGMYPRLPEFRKLRTVLDPAGILASDLSKRLNL